MAVAERTEFVELLTDLGDDEWDAPSLCGRWRVRDVVAHVFGYDELTLGELAGRFVRGRFGVDRTNAVALEETVAGTPAELIDLARRHLRPRGLTAGFGGRIALTDGTIHQQDIRRPLGRPRSIPPERLGAVLEFARIAPTIGARRRIRGLRLTATDLGWSTGRGPEVSGPGEAVLMALAGRRGATAELDGPGVAVLAERIARSAPERPWAGPAAR